ncbi:Crp/Fnr family transcriptional regulator [Siminovitchia sediminis]|uniref:Crp/Fnr family transcriptional regulator n=1 Tax=Siminovitchia sediminis TaxID=1274353 RepID=A0ABW4KHK6_9BACI
MRYEWEPYLHFGSKKKLKKGETLYMQGERGYGFYYLQKGKMNIKIVSEGGKERIIDHLLDGFLLGEQGIAEEPYSTTAICVSDVELYHFSSNAFIELCEKHPEATGIFMKALISKVRMLAETMAIINRPYEQQMAQFLVRLSKKHETMKIPVTQISLAQYIGTSRITVYKIIQKWTSQNLVQQKGRHIEILDMDEMKALYH